MLRGAGDFTFPNFQIPSFQISIFKFPMSNFPLFNFHIHIFMFLNFHVFLFQVFKFFKFHILKLKTLFFEISKKVHLHSNNFRISDSHMWGIICFKDGPIFFLVFFELFWWVINTGSEGPDFRFLVVPEIIQKVLQSIRDY